MINKKLKYSLGLIAAIAVINPAVVKGQSKEKGLDTISITLLTPYAPTISDANKKNDINKDWKNIATFFFVLRKTKILIILRQLYLISLIFYGLKTFVCQ